MNNDKEPLVSIISAYYNREDEVERTVNSLIQQRYKNIEIILIDDCSTDNTFEKLKRFEKEDSRVKVEKTLKNIGFVQVMKYAVSISKGEYIAIQGSGDVSFKDRIQKQLEVLNACSDVGLIGCLRIVEKGQPTNKLYDYKSDGWIEGNKFHGDASGILLTKNLFAHGSVMYRKSIYEKVGGYRSLFIYAQDRDLWIRMSEICHCVILDEVLYKRYILENSVSLSHDKVLLQRYLSEMAIQSACFRRRGEIDFVDKYGILAPFLLQKSKRLANVLLKDAFKWMYQGDKSISSSFIDEAYKYDRGAKITISRFVIKNLPMSFCLFVNSLYISINKFLRNETKL